MALADFDYDFEDEDLLLGFGFIDDGSTTSTTATSCDGISSQPSRDSYSQRSPDHLVGVSPTHSSNTTSEDDDFLADSHLKSSSSLTDSDAPGDAVTRPKRKRRRYPNAKDAEGNWLVPRIPLPRILKSDIRRSYGLMFTNVYNSCDYDYMMNYLDQFVSPNLLYRFTKFNVTKSLSGSKKLMGQFWYERMIEAPDVVFHFEAGRIKVRSDGTAVLSGQFSITCTRFGASPAVEAPNHCDGLETAPHDEPGEAAGSSPTSVSDPATMANHDDWIDEAFRAAEQRHAQQQQLEQEPQNKAVPFSRVIDALERLQPSTEEAPSSPPVSTGTSRDKAIKQYNQVTAFMESQCQEACGHRFQVFGELSMHLDAQYMVEVIDTAVQNVALTPVQLRG